MTVSMVKVIARGPAGPAGAGSSQTLAQVLANGHDANAVEITNGATPTADSSLDTRGARNTAITTAVATEATTRAAADTSEATTRASADIAEASARASAVTAAIATAEGYADIAVASEASARSTADALKLAKASNLSDLASAATARTNLGVPAGSGTSTGTNTGDQVLPTTLPPNGSAGGDLAGTYPNPTVAALAITDAKVAAANKDGTAGTASMRTLGTGAAQAAAGNDSRLSDSRAPSGSAGGDLTGTYPNPTLAAAGGGAAGPTGSTSVIPVVTVDAKGRVTALTSASPAIDTVGAGTDITTNNVSTTKHGLAPKLPNDATKFFDGTGAYSTPTSSPGGLSVYGDGSDGTVTFDGTTTILGLAPSSSTYTLTRDLFLAAGTINSGVSIITNGFRIFCAGTLTNNGTIKWDGNANGNLFGAGGATNSTGTISNGTQATSGSNGGTAAGTAGVNNGNQGLGAAGGAGGTGTGGAGGAGGTITAISAARGSIHSAPMAAYGLLIFPATAPLVVATGAGGGGGGGDTSVSGGGGGGGGGFVLVVAKTFAGTGAIRARGGAGATIGSGNVGGGGGGGGGIVIVISGSVSGGAISGQTIDANGGAAGSPHGTGTNNAAAGSNGTTILIPN